MKKSKEIIPIRHIALWEIWMVLGAYEWCRFAEKK